MRILRNSCKWRGGGKKEQKVSPVWYPLNPRLGILTCAYLFHAIELASIHGSPEN